jgi:hypothetical protein
MLKEKKKNTEREQKLIISVKLIKLNMIVHRRHCRSLIKLNMIGDDDHGNFASLPV